MQAYLFSFSIIFLVLPFAIRWYLTKYLPAWSDVVELIKNCKKKPD